MSRFLLGWRTTIEPSEQGYPVRYWWSEDEHMDVAWCGTQGSAAAVCSALGAAKARPNVLASHGVDPALEDDA